MAGCSYSRACKANVIPTEVTSTYSAIEECRESAHSFGIQYTESPLAVEILEAVNEMYPSMQVRTR